MTSVRKDAFANAITKASRADVTKKQKESVYWYKAFVDKTHKNKISMANAQKMDGITVKNRMELGKMYMFAYNAKHKDTLPYWDAQPLIIMLQEGPNYVLGLNLHYLPPIYRAKLMDALYTVISNEKMDKTTKFKVTYNILQAAAKFRLFQPCIKKYLKTHFVTRFGEVSPHYWNVALFLPTAKWQKANTKRVYTESMDKVNGHTHTKIPKGSK